MPKAPPVPSSSPRVSTEVLALTAESPGETTGVTPAAPVVPAPPRSLAETGLSEPFLTSLALKHLYSEGVSSGLDVAHAMRLPWRGVIEPIFDALVLAQLLEMQGGRGFGRASVNFSLTARGREAAQAAMSRSTYAGPAPVPLAQYAAQVRAEARQGHPVTRPVLAAATAHLVFDPRLLDSLGPALSAARTLFLFGDAGNGKTAMAEAMSRAMGGGVAVPHAVEVDGQVIGVLDLAWHVPLREAGAAAPEGEDQRWVVCRRPFFVVGGELSLDMLEVAHHAGSNVYEAPCHMKANGGMLLVDDFGRQRVAARELLNRWIIPLEKRVDLLALASGRKFEVPMEEIVVFSTNLEPAQLVDEAFLRRIKYKVRLPDPSEADFREIFKRRCEALQLGYHAPVVDWLLESYYRPYQRPLRASHPRDLLQILCDISAFRGEKATLAPTLLDLACRLFFAASDVAR